MTNKLPAVDTQGRPTFAYGRTVHSQCPRPYGCLEELRCRGKQSYNNCPTAKFNDKTNWCINAVHQCIGCAQPQFSGI